MTVYVELLFGLNTIINYLMLRGSAAIGGSPAKFGRLLAAAALGGGYAVAAVVLDGLQSVLWQGFFAGMMLVIAFGWKRSTVKLGLFFFALSFALGGAVLLLVQWVEPDCLILGGRAYYALSMPALLLVAGAGYGLAALVLSGCGTHTGGDLISMGVSLGDRSTSLRALRDTGNVLRDPVSGQPVLVADSEAVKRLLPALQTEHCQNPVEGMQWLSAEYPSLRFRLVPYRSVGVDHGMLLAVRAKCCWKGNHCATLVACSPTPVSSDGRFEAIWGGECV